MSIFLRHESCPKCGSRDNLSVWDDGHKWCFGCGHYIPANGRDLTNIKRRIFPDKKEDSVVSLPLDASFSIPSEGVEWCQKYFVGYLQMGRFRIQWSPARRAMILPIYDDEHELVFYQTRHFGDHVEHRNRYLSYGKLDNLIPVFNPISPSIGEDVVVIVEDYLSAIRVSEFLPTVPLFGAHISETLARRLSTQYKQLHIWLDFDKFKDAISYYEKYCVLFDNCSVINTNQDPKAYRAFDIKNILQTQLRKVEKQQKV
jgi:Zn ribbon nucleic-acid-binding protein